MGERKMAGVASLFSPIPSEC